MTQLLRLAIGAALVGTLALVGCSNGDGSDRPDPGSTGSRSVAGDTVARVQLVAAPDATTVAAGSSDGARALQISRALFAGASTVVLAAADPNAQKQAARVAESLGVPMLLSPAASPARPTGPTSPASQANPARSTPEVAPADISREMARLHASTALTFGSGAARFARRLGGVRVVADSRTSGRPALRHGAPPARTVVLIRRGETSIAALATARAAAARVVPVNGRDLRRDPAAIAAIAAAPVGAVVSIGGSLGAPLQLRRRVDVAATGAQLPGGGQVLLPGRRLVALYGHPNSPSLGSLGEQPLAASIRRAKRLAADYAKVSTVPVIPAFEMMATVAAGSPGKDGNYSYEHKLSRLRPWVQAAGRAGVYVVLDLQPGRADFLTQARRYESLLVLPHVGLGLDPEWRLKNNQVHGRQVGTVTAREINQTTAWLADLTARHKLPQKLVVLHQFRLPMISQRRTLDASRDELAILIQMDGFGPPGSKLDTWRAVLAQPPAGVRFGWKNFIDEDKPTFTPARTVRLVPSPGFVSYQ